MHGARLEWFQSQCALAGLSCTHQRQVIYKALLDSGDHPSPEMLFERVKLEIPSISLATVYRNIRTFLDHGLIAEAGHNQGTLRLEANYEPHHHLVCRACHRIFDLPSSALTEIRFRNGAPATFQPERFTVEVHGLCGGCAPLNSKENTQ